MKILLSVVIKIYTHLLTWYPRSYQDEFVEEMFLDFSDMAADASKKGVWALTLFGLRELVDFPASLLQAYWREDRPMERVFRSRPVNYGVRGAIGFAVAFFLDSLFERFIYQKFAASSEAVEDLLWDLFHAPIPGNAVFLISFFVSVLVTGLLFGIAAALLFADRSRYFRYIVASMAGWFLWFAVGNVVDETLGNTSFYLGTKYAAYLTQMIWVLSCAFLGLIFVVARNNKKGPYRCFVAGAFVYPLLFYFCIRLLFWIGWIETPYLFIALAALVVLCIGSVFVIAIKSEDQPRIPWTFLVFAIGFPLMAYGTGFILRSFVPSWQAFISASSSAHQNWRQVVLLAMLAGLFEIPLGIFIGITLGLQKQSIHHS